MFHSNTELLIDSWRRLVFAGLAPERAKLDPREFARAMPQTFITGRAETGAYPIRLAGELIRDLFGRDLRGENLMDLWHPASRLELRSAMELARRGPAPIVAAAKAKSADGRETAVEVFLAPLRGADGQSDRFLGLLQPTQPVQRLLGEQVRTLVLQSIAGADAEDAPRLRLAALDGRRIA